MMLCMIFILFSLSGLTEVGFCSEASFLFVSQPGILSHPSLYISSIYLLTTMLCSHSNDASFQESSQLISSLLTSFGGHGNARKTLLDSLAP